MTVLIIGPKLSWKTTIANTLSEPHVECQTWAQFKALNVNVTRIIMTDDIPIQTFDKVRKSGIPFVIARK